MSPSFLLHLHTACGLPLNEPLFLESYRHVLKAVSEHGTFALHGLTVDAPAGVYSPHETSSTRFVMDRFSSLGLDLAGGRLLEVGCGSGAISLLAARQGWEVTASDIDPAAVAATRANAALNGLTLAARTSDLFSAFEAEQFDVILFNQPFFHVEREILMEERTLSDTGGALHVRFMAEALKHVKPTGCVLFSYSNCSNLAVLNQPGWSLSLRAFDFDAGTNYVRALFRATAVSTGAT